jgi:L-rhamnonate dehydratase
MVLYITCKENIMKIKKIECVQLRIPPSNPPKSQKRRDAWAVDAEVANPMSVYPKYKRYRPSWLPRWGGTWVKVTAEDGTWGLGTTSGGPAVEAVIKGHFAPMLEGEDCLAREKVWDMMFRMSKPYGTLGLSCLAMSAVDLALWDLAGRFYNQPVYKLLGGAVRDKIQAYATGNDVDWYVEIGFKAVKLACPYGPADGLWGLEENEKFVAKARETVGDHVEIMLDCYMAFDVEYTIRLAERLKPYKLKWIEECLIPEDIDGWVAIKKAVNWVDLATGEHNYTRYPFMQYVERRCLDVLQPDINWVGGLSETVKIAHIAEGAKLSVIPHGGANQAYGQHFSCAVTNVPMIEFFVGSPPGIPLDETIGIPGTVVPKDGYIFPSDAPGFGYEIKEDWIVAQ